MRHQTGFFVSLALSIAPKRTERSRGCGLPRVDRAHGDDPFQLARAFAPCGLARMSSGLAATGSGSIARLPAFRARPTPASVQVRRALVVSRRQDLPGQGGCNRP